MDRYSDTLTGTITANAVKNPTTGDWTPGAQTTFTSPCRAESESNNGYITAEDGQRIDFSWIVYLPKETAPIKIGTAVSVTSEGSIILSDTVKRYSTGWFNCRIWL